MHVPLISHIAGCIANISSNIAFLPQIVKTYRRKKLEDVSMGMFFVLFTTQICWILYAVPIGAVNLWISSLIEVVLLLPLFVMWLLYSEKMPGWIKKIRRRWSVARLKHDSPSILVTKSKSA